MNIGESNGGQLECSTFFDEGHRKSHENLKSVTRERYVFGCGSGQRAVGE